MTGEVVVLRGEYHLNTKPNTVICSPNAKRGEVITLSADGFSGMVHIDNEGNLEQLKRILNEIKTTYPDFKCNIMGRDSGKLRGQITDLLQQYEPQELNQETWSGSHAYNIKLKSDGTVEMDNNSEESRRFYNSVMFAENGSERMENAVGDHEIKKLTEIKTAKNTVKAIEVKKLSSVSRNKS